MSPDSVGFAVVLLAAVMLLGKYLRVKVALFQKLLLPSAIIAGFLGLLLGPQVLGRLGEPLGWSWLENGGLFTDEIYEVWGMLPGLLISVVFATLFLGARIPSPSVPPSWWDRSSRWAWPMAQDSTWWASCWGCWCWPPSSGWTRCSAH